MKRLTIVLTTAVLLLAPARALRADPVVLGDTSAFIVSDFLNADGSFDDWGTFLLPDLVTGVFGREIFANARLGCSPCAAGDVIDLSGSFELRGPNYQSGGPNGAVYGVGTLNFHSSAVVVPQSDAASVSLIAPFVMDGFVSFYRVPNDTLIFSDAVTGQGQTRAFLWRTETEGRAFHQQHYFVGQHPFEPVPEPSTLLLCAGGLAFLLGHARARQALGRRRRRDEDLRPGVRGFAGRVRVEGIGGEF